MKENKFIWADLSSYQPERIKPFYEAVFGWKYNGEEYSIAHKENKEVVGLYQTPLKFQKIKMPSFWMSYIQVEDVLETVEKAKSLGGIIELVDIENSIGKVALIRDTLGAGFTVYQGSQLDSRTKSEENTLIFNELHISDMQKAIIFYQGLFNWNFKKANNSVEVFSDSFEEKIITIRQIDNTIKGKYEYWVCVFGVKNLQSTSNVILKNGGLIVSEEENRVLCSDGSEAFFYIQEV